MVSWSDEMISEAKLDLGFARSSIVGSEPKSPIEVRNTRSIIKRTGPKMTIQTHFIQEMLDSLDVFFLVESVVLLAMVNGIG